MNIVCYYINVLGHTIKYCREKANQQKKINTAPKTANEKRREIKQVWRNKQENMTMGRDCAFNA